VKRGETFPRNRDLRPIEIDAMNKTTTITLAVQPKVLKSAGRVLRQAGLNTPDAVTLFLKQVVLHGGLPFDAGAANVKARRGQHEPENPAPCARTRRRPLAEDPLASSIARWKKNAKPYK
jgi:addiction module RelB/DinJ family antitoxin